ncbi:MAG: glycosyltransferase [Elainellaceae cyanobacterium]
MTHFGTFCPPSTGHLNTMMPLAQELQRRGHRVTHIGVLDAQPKAVAAGLDFRAIGEDEFPLGSVPEAIARLGKMTKLAALRYTIQLIQEGAFIRLRDAPSVVKSAGIDALLIDQLSSGAESVADHLSIPFISVCSAIPINQEVGVPPCFTPWHYSPFPWNHLRNHMGYALINQLSKPIQTMIIDYRHERKLPPYRQINDAYSRLAQLSQQPAEFEFPRTSLPPCFHFTGPYHDSVSREPVPFPFERLTGQPIIYASMGTLQNRLVDTFYHIAEACVGMDAQLVISLGGAFDCDALPQLPGAPIIVNYAPQLQLLQKAALTITHAGLNTTLESLSNGVPMVAIPVTNDQPGVAARISWTGTGEVVPLSRLHSTTLKSAIQTVLNKASYSTNALRLKEAIHRAGGVSRAADIIEQVVSSKETRIVQT